MITINTNQLDDNEELKYAEINAATYIKTCLKDEEIDILKDKWNAIGGTKAMPWYKWVLQNTSISLDL